MQKIGQESQADTVRPQTRMAYIDALRGFACLWVLFYHSLTTTGAKHAIPGAQHLPVKFAVGFVSLGFLGVNLFLVLSGFCLFYPLIRKMQREALPFDIRTFFLRRSRRILPPYYAALVVFTILTVIHGSPLHRHLPWYDVPLHLLMAHNLSPESIASINAVFWSLALEWQLYLVFPLLIALFARRGIMAVLATALAISLLWQAGVLHHFGPAAATPLASVFYRALPGRLFEFVAGMGAAYLVARPRPSQASVAAAAAVLLAVVAGWYTLSVAKYGILLDQTWGIVFASVIVAFRQLPEKLFTSPGRLGAFTSVGIFSYSVYLIHEPLMGMITVPALHLHLAGAKYAAFSLVRIFVLVGIGYLFFLVAERPFLTTRKQRVAELIRDTVAEPAP